MMFSPFHQIASAIWFLLVGLSSLIFCGRILEDLQRRRWTPLVLDGLIALATLSLLASAAFGQTLPSSPPPRRLVVWNDIACGNCRDFWEDYHAGLGQELLEAGWIVERWEIRQRPLQAWALGIRCVPCFVIPGSSWTYGYRRDEFRRAFGLESNATTPMETPSGEASPLEVSENQVQGWLAEQLAEQRAQLEAQLAETMAADHARQVALEEALADQRRTLEELRTLDPDPRLADRLDEISATLDRLGQQPPTAPTAPADPSGAPLAETPAASGSTPPAGGWFLRLGRFALTAGEAAGLFGLSTFGTYGALTAAGVAWRLGGRLWRRFRGRGATSAPSSGPSYVPTSPNPPANCTTCAQLRERVAHLEQELGDLQTNPPRVDDSVGRFHRAMAMVAQAHPGDHTFSRWRNLVLQHYRLITSGDGVTSNA